MMISVASTIINALIIVLLAITIGYCWLLNRRIRILQDSRREMAKLLKHFDTSTQRASESIVALQSASRKIGESIQQRMESAQEVMDDMNFIMEKANKLANQLEACVAISRAQLRSGVSATTSNDRPMHQRPQHQQRANKDSLWEDDEQDIEHKQHQPVKKQNGSSSLSDSSEKSPPFSRYELPKELMKSQEMKPQTRSRARTEQELMELIKSGMKG